MTATVSIDLPDVEIGLKTRPNLPGDLNELIIWFSDGQDWRAWHTALGLPGGTCIAKTSGYCMALKAVVGLDNLAYLDRGIVIIYLPFSGISDMTLYSWLAGNRRNYQFYFVRLFNQEDLALLPGDDSPFKRLWLNVRSEFTTSPFLGLADQKAAVRLKQWLARIVVLANLPQHRSELSVKLEQAVPDVEHLLSLWASAPAEIVSRTDLLQLVALRDESRREVRKIYETEEDLTQSTYCLEDLPVDLDRIALLNYEASGKNIFGIDFRINLGDELLPDLQILLPKLESFAGQLLNSNLESIKALGTSLKEMLKTSAPVMALIGPFSSGKTTLLNMLLMERGSKRAFRTSNTSNTAIISEIGYCEEQTGEHVRFIFRDRIEHYVSNFKNQDSAPVHQKVIKELISLIKSGVLEDPAIIQVLGEDTAKSNSAKNVKPYYSGSDAVLRFLNSFNWLDSPSGFPLEGRLIVSARVNARKRSEILNDNLPEFIDLSSERGWLTFQGDGAGTEPFIEQPTVTFLIEVASIQLRNRLLKLTTIADTPGTGSFNNRHDFITEQYLYRAEGFVLLLPTKNVDAQRVYQIVRKVRDVFASRYGNPAHGLDYIAFVVNCFTRQEEEVVMQTVNKFEQMIIEVFGLTQKEWKARQSNSRKANFFVVKLKNIEEGQNPERVYGRPALLHLRDWIRKLFLSGRYRNRLMQIRNVVEVEWDERRSNLNRRIREFQTEAQERAALMAAVKKFYEEELVQINKSYTESISSFRSEFDSDPYSIRKKVEAQLDSFVNDPFHFQMDRIESLKNNLRELYKEFNIRLAEIEENDPVSDWIEEIKRGLKKAKVDPPSLVPLDPTKQDVAWSGQSRFDPGAINRKFDEILANWPNVFGRMWNRLKDATFGEDIRRAIAKDLRYNFWPAHYGAIWDRRLDTYLRRAEEFIKTKSVEAEQMCKKREEYLKNLNESKKRELDREAGVFNSFETYRKSLIADLEIVLEGKRGNPNE